MKGPQSIAGSGARENLSELLYITTQPMEPYVTTYDDILPRYLRITHWLHEQQWPISAREAADVL